MNYLIIALALGFDALSLIPGINDYVAVAGQAILGLAFYLRGTNVLKSKPAVLYVITTIIEAIPAASAFPMFTVEALILLYLSRRKA
jgi:hypothetical protein